jgi:hypothetical protein
MAHDLTLLAVVFVLGLAMLAYGLASRGKSLPLSLTAIVGGSAIAILSGVTVKLLEPAVNAFKPGIAGDVALAIVAWIPAGFIGACTFEYRLGPRRLPGRIALSGVSALFVGLLLSQVHHLPVSEVEGLLLWFVIPIVVLLFVGRYQPSSRWRIWIRRTALSSLAVSMGSVFVWWRSAWGRTNGSYFWEVNFGFGHWVHLPHPYDYYEGQLNKYLGSISLLLTVVCSVACLCVWTLDTLKIKALPVAKPLS